MHKVLLFTFVAAFFSLLFIGSAHSSNELELKLEAWMTKKFPAQNSRWEVWLLPSKKLKSHQNYTIKGIKGLQKPKKVMAFIVASDEKDDENNSQIVVVEARVVRFVKVSTAKHIIRRGMVLQKKDWQVIERNAAQVPYDAILDFSKLELKRAKKVIARKEIVTAHALEKSPDIETGKRLTLQVCGDGVTIRTDVTSLNEGHIGEWVKFKNCLNGQILKGELVSSELAQIQLNRRPQ